MAEQDLKLIENHIKDLLFKNASAAPQPPPVPNNPDLNYNMNPYSFSDKSFLPSREDTDHRDKLVSSMPLDCSLNKEPSSSQLIDLNVLTDFAAKHADITNDLISNSFPHPELENDLLGNPGTSIVKDILLNCNATQENTRPSKFSYFPLNMPCEDLKNIDKDSIDNESAASDKKKGKKTRKQVAKEKTNQRAPVNVMEKPINQSVLSSSMDPPKEEINDVKHSSSSKRGEDLEESCRNSIGPEHSDNADYATFKKKKRERKSRKKISKEKKNRKDPGNFAEKPLNQSIPTSIKESPKRETIPVNKLISAPKEAPRSPEKKVETILHELGAEKPKIPLPLEEREYTLFATKDGYKFVCHICNYESRSRDYYSKHLNSDNHREIKKQIQSDRILPFLPPPVPGQITAITDLLMKFHAEHGLKSEDMILREKLASRLKEFLEDNLPDCYLEMVGSSVTGLGLRKSKVDFTLKVGPNQNIPDSLELLYEKLGSDPSYCNLKSDFKKKKVEILFTDKETGLNCSIILENLISEKYARLFYFYSELDPRVKVLASCFRHWAELCLLDNQDRGTLPSITFPILLVYFLQQVEPPVLPVLHELKEYGNADFAESYVKKGLWKSENDSSVGELWIKLFYFYNFIYKKGKQVVCIRTIDKVLSSEKNWNTKFYAIEDPFSRRNIAHVIPSFQVCQYIQQCFLRTYRYFAFPQVSNGEIKLIKNEEFETFLLSYASDKYEAMDDSSDESAQSDNEDSSIPDETSFIQDFEDHDPDLPIESVLLTMKDMQLDDSKGSLDGEGMEDSHEPAKAYSSKQDSVKAESPKKETRKNKDKLKTEEKITIKGTCLWDLGDLQITELIFTYNFDPVFFKGDKKDVPLYCKLCKLSGHLKKNCPSEDRIPRPMLPEMTSDFLRVINKTLHYIKDKNCVDEKDKISMQNIMRNIESHIKILFPEASLSMFGSFCNGFGFKIRSDMDFCLTFKDRENIKDLNCTEVIEALAKHLGQFPKLDDIIAVTSAKVPIVKFTCMESGLEGDISLYNTLAIANTEMLELYSRIDSRVQVLGFALKYFAKVLGICDASRGSLSSYAYILMVIYFLQQRQPPVIPVLQELHDGEKPVHMVDEWNVWYFKEFDKLPKIWPDYAKNTETAAELWLGLLSFYAYDFDWREYVVSIRQKALVTRFRKLWNTDQIAIEDPFDLNHNLGAGLSRKMNMYILRTFARGYERFGTALPAHQIVGLQGREVVYLFDRRFLNCGAEPPHDRGCRSCGKIGHIAKNCTKEKECSYCKKPGHLVKNCPRKKPKKNKQDRNIQENSTYENKSNVESQSLLGHPLRAQSNEMQRTNNAPFNHLPKNSDDSTRKLLQMGFPTHRHPPPRFAKSFKGPPPAFKPMHLNSTKFNRFPHPCPAPFPRTMPVNDMSKSPPKHFSSSPPKNYAASNMFIPEPIPPMGIRTGLMPDPHMPPPDPHVHRMWQNSMPNRMAPQYMDRRKRTN